MMGLENMKVISCRDEVKQFAKKYLIPDWIDVTEIKSGFLLKFPFGEVDSCKLIQSNVYLKNTFTTRSVVYMFLFKISVFLHVLLFKPGSCFGACFSLLSHTNQAPPF